MKFYTGFGENRVENMGIKSDDRFVIITGTNRPNSVSEMIAMEYGSLLSRYSADIQYVHLRDLPKDFVYTDTWEELSPPMQEIVDNVMAKATKFIFVIPEYNGGFPGVLKAFIDCVPPKHFHEKKAGLIGLSSGRAGAARAMDQFSNVLNYLKVNVLFLKPKLSQIEAALHQGALNDERMSDLLAEHAKRMISF